MKTMLFLGLASLLACTGDDADKDSETGVETDADTDTDTDSDTDADTDTDTDADTDSDTDADPNACPQNVLGGLGTYQGTLSADLPSDLTPSCGSGSPLPEVTWEFPAGPGGFFKVDTIGTSFDTVLSIHRSCFGNDDACNDDDPLTETAQSAIVFPFEGGTRYIIAVEAADETVDIGNGEVVLNLSRVELCGDNVDNDGNGLADCFDPACASGPTCCPLDSIANLGGFSGNLIGNPSLTDPSCGGVGGPETTFEFTPAETGRYRFNTNLSDFDTVLSVLDGCGGVELACDDNGFVGGSTGASQLDVDLVAGTSYVVTVDVLNAATLPGLGNVVGSVRLLDPEICDDDVDNDIDGLIDCGDPDCAGPQCPFEICTDGADNDADLEIDCFDADCLADPICGDEICDDIVDNDTNGLADCLDADNCIDDAACCPVVLTTGLGTYNDTLEPNSSVNEPTCGGFDSFDTSFEFTPPVDGAYRLDTLGSAFDTVVSVRDACAGAEIACSADSPFSPVFARLDVELVGGTTYIVYVDAQTSTTQLLGGAVTLDISEVPPETCDDGIDNSGNGLADCLDAGGCFDDPACCPDVVTTGLGLATATLLPDSDVNEPSCGLFGSDGYDTTFEFTPTTDGLFLFDTAGSSFDTVVSVRDACGGTELACNDDDLISGAIEGRVQAELVANTPYIVYVDAADLSTPLNGGAVSLNIVEIQPEVCDDTLDNDLDGLTDCADFEGCEGDGACCPLNPVPGPNQYTTTLPADFNVNEPSCGGLGGWDTSFTFTPPADGNYRFDTFGSSFDTVLSVDEGGCGGLEIACNDEAPAGGPQSEIQGIGLIGGTEYIIHVDAFNDLTNQNLNGGFVVLNVTQL